MQPTIRQLTFLLALSTAVSYATAAGRPAVVDLRQWQTPIRDQAERGTCFIHATIAAMEAQLRRSGREELNLSEEFSDYVGSLLYLEVDEFDGKYRTGRMRVPGPLERESGIVIAGIPSGTIETMVGSEPCVLLGIPDERYMPYSSTSFDPEGHPDANDDWWKSQYNVGTYMLSSNRLPLSALTAPAYYRVKKITWLPREDAAKSEMIEQVLAGGHEVIWDFATGGDMSHRIWQYTQPTPDSCVGHRMLLVGYDRRNPTNKFFIAKNSWGHPALNEPGDNFTLISYDYIKYGSWASYISELAPAEPWPELAFIGRWKIKFGTHEGLLDIYHLPGMMQTLMDHNGFADEAGGKVIDRRLGTFYEGGNPAKAYRVNGTLSGISASMYVDFTNPGPRWDKLRGTLLDVKLTTRAKDRMEGSSRDPAGSSSSLNAQRATISSPAPAAGSGPAVPKLTPDEKKARENNAKNLQNQDKTAANATAPAPSIEAKRKELEFLGAAQIEPTCCPDERGWYVHYEAGSIYWSPETGAHAIYGAIRDKWAELGWENSRLGYPKSDEEDNPEDGGRLNWFQHGSIKWHPDSGARVVLDEKR